MYANEQNHKPCELNEEVGKILEYDRWVTPSAVTPRALPTPITVYPPGFDINAKCEYHGGSPNHTTDNYKALKYKVQDLISTKLLNFKEMGPNVKNNTMPEHDGP